MSKATHFAARLPVVVRETRQMAIFLRRKKLRSRALQVAAASEILRVVLKDLPDLGP